MNVSGALATPWRATNRISRWMTLIIFLGCCVGAIVFGILVQSPDWWIGCTLIYCLGIGFLWMFLMSSLLLVATDARQLSLPGVSVAIAWALVLYGVLCVAVFTVIMAAVGAPVLTAASLVGLAITASLAFALMPGYVSIMIAFLPALSIRLWRVIPVPSISDPRFAAACACTLLVLLLVTIWRWRQLLYAARRNESGYGSAMVVMWFRLELGMSRWGQRANQGSSQRMRKWPEWSQPRVNLRGVGPHQPVLALRIALGSWCMPQTWLSYAKQIAPVPLSMLLVLLPVAILRAGVQEGGRVGVTYVGVGIGAAGCIALFVGPLLAIGAASLVRQQWSRLNTELPMLALLPGLGDATTVQRALLRAILLRPLLLQTLLWITLLCTGVALHANATLLALVTLSQLAFAGLLIASVLATLGGRDLSTWATAVLMSAAFMLASVSVFIPLLAMGEQPWEFAVPVERAFAVCWAVLGAGLFWLGRRGWHGLRQRSHPFLPNE